MEGLLPDARKEQIFDDFNDTSTTSTRSISSISSTTSNGYIEIHHNGNFLSFLVSSNINEYDIFYMIMHSLDCEH
ncbi:unnamed protein product [Rotaria magnacalcarata]